MRFLLLLGASLNLAACSTVESVRPDIAAKPLPSRLDEIAYINELRAAYEIASDSRAIAAGMCFEGEGIKNLRAFKSASGQGYVDARDPENYSISNACIRFKTLSPTKGQNIEIRNYLSAGFGLTDLYCERFFTVASASQRNRVFGKSFSNGVDSLVGAALSLSGAGSTATGIVNSSFGLLDDTFDAYDTAYMVGAEFSEVRRLVVAAQGEYRRETFATKSARFPLSYSGARSVIERYAAFCSYAGMQELVSKAVNDKSDQLSDSDEPKDPQNEKAGNIQSPPIAN